MPRILNQSAFVVAAAYLLPLALIFLFWTMSDSSHWTGGFMPWIYRLLVAAWNAAGPLAFPLNQLGQNLLALTCIVVALWASWLSHVLATPLKTVPIHLHLLASCVWLFIDFMRTSLIIT